MQKRHGRGSATSLCKPTIPQLNMDKVREWVAKCEAYERKKKVEEDLKLNLKKD